MKLCLRHLVNACRSALLCLAFAFSPKAFATEGKEPPRSVVVLHSFPYEMPGEQELTAAIVAGLRKDPRVPIDIYTEYTGLDRFTGPTYEASLLTLYNEKYATRKVDLLIIVGPTAFEFVMSHRFLEGVPVVTCYVAQRFVEAARARRPALTGALPAPNAPRTLELMLTMFPGTKRIHVVLGASQHEREQAVRGGELFRAFEDRVQIDYWNNLSLEQMEERLRTLPDADLVLYGSVLRDAAGRDYYTNEALSRVSRASRRPVFGVISEDLGFGIAGGVLLSMELSGKASAELGLKVLAGQPAGSIPLVADTGAVAMFDWRQLKRWGIKERSLPTGSIVKFRKVGLWDSYWKEISLGLGVIGLESLLIAGLVLQLRRRKRIERELAQAEVRYRTVADFTHDWEFWQRPDGTFEYVSPACARVAGHVPEDFKETPDLLQEIVLEEDRPAWLTFRQRALEGASQSALEYRIRTQSGEVRWVEEASNPVRLEEGHFAGSRGSIRDITDRKQSELDLKRAYAEIRALKDRLEAENTYYREQVQLVEGSSELLGQSDAMKYLLFRVRQVAPSDTTVLIQGETGTGKELVAEAIHTQGPRKDRALVKVNCAAFPPGLAESELFGHEKGAFTGAQSLRKGRFELADGATLFLDEVGELTPEIQAKLLRVLQDGQFQRVGGDRTLRVDVRVIAATNRDLTKEVSAGKFREDLYYRLNVFPITVPPLRQRIEDIPVLAQAFVARFCQKLGRPALELPHSVVNALKAYTWPGNVRELQNLMERAVLVSEGRSLRLAEALGSGKPAPTSDLVLKSLEDMERDYILQVMEACQGRIEGAQGAAAILGLKPSTLRSRMAKLGIDR